MSDNDNEMYRLLGEIRGEQKATNGSLDRIVSWMQGHDKEDKERHTLMLEEVGKLKDINAEERGAENARGIMRAATFAIFGILAGFFGAVFGKH